MSLSDTPEKNKKKQMIIMFGGVAFFVGLLVFGMWMSDPNKGKLSPLEIAEKKRLEVSKNYTTRSSEVASAEDTWISKSEKEIQRIKQDSADTKKLVVELYNLVANKKNESANIPSNLNSANVPNATPVNLGGGEGVIPPPPPPQPKIEEKKKIPESNDSASNGLKGILPPPPIESIGYSGQEGSEKKTLIQVVSFDDPEADKGADKRKNIKSYFPTGSIGTVVLLSGMDAPTGGSAMQNPVPVLLRLMDTGTLANYFESDVKNCHVTGAGYGDISSHRAKIRTEVITCILENGDVVEEKIEGFIAGEDGKEGMRGNLIEKQGSLIAKSLLAGTLSGMSSAISQQYQQVSTTALGTTQTIDPSKVGQSGVSEGASNALEKVAEYYMARANEIYPIIEIDANRIGEIILTNGTDFKMDIIGKTRQRR